MSRKKQPEGLVSFVEKMRKNGHIELRVLVNDHVKKTLSISFWFVPL
jgi:hypothetical protein